MTYMLALTLIALLLVVASLVGGVISMGHGGEIDNRHATHFMFARVGFQILVVFLLMSLAYANFV